MDLKDTVRSIPDYPEKGILFRDITTLLKDKDAFNSLIEQIARSLEGKAVDAVVGPEARGFIMGAPVSFAIHAGFIPARKPGKLPCETESMEYALEYGTDKLEIHKDAIKKGMRVAVVDDLLATGGTAKAVCRLIEKMGGEVVAVRFAIELSELDGRETLCGYDVDSVIKY